MSRRAPATPLALAVGVALAAGLAACKDEKTRLPFSSAQAPALITGPADVELTVRDVTGQIVVVLVEYSLDQQLTFTQATAVPGTAATPTFPANGVGATALFRWDPIRDLGPGIHRDVALRVNAAGRELGQGVIVTGLTVDLSDRLDALTGPIAHRPVAVPLQDGSVWVAGGEAPGGGSPLSAAARFDPVTGAFAATTGLTEARAGASAALLSSGAVLVVGGRDAGGAPRPTAEVVRVDAAGLATVQAAGPLVVAREAPAVAALPDGRAVVVGGRGAAGPAPEVEVFTPGAGGGGAFSVAFSDARAARVGATATALADGRVLVAGGFDAAGQPLTEALLLDAAATGLTSAGTTAPRGEHAATRLADGRVLLAGGTGAAGDATRALASADLYDPTLGRFLAVGAMGERRRAPGLAYAGGFALAVGGSGSAAAPTTAERLDPGTLTWSPIAGPGALARPDAVAVATGPGRAVVVGGGVGPEVYTPDAALGATEAFDEVRSVPAPRAGHTATRLGDGAVLVVGGTARVTSAVATVERFDPVLRAFTARTPLGRARTGHAAVLLASGSVLVVGGRDAAGPVAEAEVYDPFADRWTDGGALLTPRADAVAAPLGDGTVVVAGGVDAAGAALASQEVWEPTTRTFRAGPPLGEARAPHDAVPTGGSVLVGPGRGAGGATAGADYDVLLPGLTLRPVAPSGGARGRGALAAPLAFPGVALLAGGDDAAGAPRGEVAFLDLRPSTPAFLAAAQPLVLARAAARATALRNGADVVLTGGRVAASPATDAAELFVGSGRTDLETGTSRATGDPRQVKARIGHTATLLNDGRVLLVGGLDERGVAIAGAELLRR